MEMIIIDHPPCSYLYYRHKPTCLTVVAQYHSFIITGFELRMSSPHPTYAMTMMSNSTQPRGYEHSSSEVLSVLTNQEAISSLE